MPKYILNLCVFAILLQPLSAAEVWMEKFIDETYPGLWPVHFRAAELEDLNSALRSTFSVSTDYKHGFVGDEKINISGDTIEINGITCSFQPGHDFAKKIKRTKRLTAQMIIFIAGILS